MADGTSFASRARAALGTVRLRTTVAAVVIVGVALVAGGFALVIVLRYTLTDEVRTAARTRAEAVAVAIENGASADRFTGAAEVDAEADDDVFVQILDDAGRVISQSGELGDARRPLARIQPGESRRIEVEDEGGRFVAVAVAAETPDGPRVVLVARTLDAVADATEVVATLLLVGLPLLLVLVGVTTWNVVGRALRPVDAIRSEVDEISASQLHRRVTNPPGRDEIARLAATMNRMLDRLDVSQQRQQQFVSDASHELRSPVASIREHAEVAIAYPDRMSATELAEAVLAEDLRVQHLVEDLLLLARADEQTLAVHRRPVDLDDFVFDEARRLRMSSELRVDTTGVSAARVLGDASALRRVVANLGENAARHARSRVVFSLAELKHEVVFAVDDDGVGVPAEQRERVFERFVRLDDARARDGGGSGLGLAIVAQVVTAHGGSVKVLESAAGGARFEVRLPAGSPD